MFGPMDIVMRRPHGTSVTCGDPNAIVLAQGDDRVYIPGDDVVNFLAALDHLRELDRPTVMELGSWRDATDEEVGR